MVRLDWLVSVSHSVMPFEVQRYKSIFAVFEKPVLKFVINFKC